MRDQDYIPCYLSSITAIDDYYYILNVNPQFEYDEDYYYEIHIKAPYSLKIIWCYVNDYIYIDLISADKLEIYYGEFYSECCSDGEFQFSLYSYEKIEKTSRLEWKPKVQDLTIKLNNLVIEKAPFYRSTVIKVINRYQAIYEEHLQNIYRFGLTVAEIKKCYPFRSLDHFNWTTGRFSDFSFEYHLKGLIGQYQICRLEKDWEWVYLDLEIRFNNLLKFDLGDYQLIKNQLINIYTKIFEHNLPHLRYQFENCDEQKYIALFDSIIGTFDQSVA